MNWRRRHPVEADLAAEKRARATTPGYRIISLAVIAGLSVFEMCAFDSPSRPEFPGGTWPGLAVFEMP
jgi:hypothetical protein